MSELQWSKTTQTQILEEYPVGASRKSDTSDVCDKQAETAKRQSLGPHQLQCVEHDVHASPMKDKPLKRSLCRKRKNEDKHASLKNELQKGKKSNPKKAKVRRFASQAHLMIGNLSTNAPDVASWSDSGEMIIIKNRTQFTKELHNYFNTTKFESFTKQLNVYGFMKGSPGWEIVNGKPKPILRSSLCSEKEGNKEVRTCGVRFNEEHTCFWHPYFQRERTDLLCNVQPENRCKEQKSKHADPLQSNETSKLRRDRLSCQVEKEGDDAENDVPVDTIEFWRHEVLKLENLVEERKNNLELMIKDLQLRQCKSIQEIAEDIKGQCSLMIEGDRGMVLDDTKDCEEAPDPSTAHLNPWVKRPKLNGLQAKIHASYAKLFDIAEPLVFAEYGLHTLLSDHFKLKGETEPKDFLEKIS